MTEWGVRMLVPPPTAHLELKTGEAAGSGVH